jgi:protein phosphatase methylesterase 1
VCHHGAGTSGLSFACFAKEVTDLTKGECGVLAIDARRHGERAIKVFVAIDTSFKRMLQGKTTSEENDENLSIEILTDDFYQLIQTLFPDPQHSPSLLVRKSTLASICVLTIGAVHRA